RGGSSAKLPSHCRSSSTKVRIRRRVQKLTDQNSDRRSFAGSPPEKKYIYALARSDLCGRALTAARADLDRLRKRAGGRPNSRLNARLKDGSDSYPTSVAICRTLLLVDLSICAPS